MASHRVLLVSSSSRSLASQLSKKLSLGSSSLHKSSTTFRSTASRLSCKPLFYGRQQLQTRWLSSSSGGGGGDDDEKKKDTNNSKEEEDDPFGLNFQDGSDGLGNALPPVYKRDAATGRLSNEIQAQLSEEDKQVLAATSSDHSRVVEERLEQHWKDQGKDESGLPAELDRLGQRVRESDMATNVLGRSVKAQAASEILDDGSKLGRDESGFSQHLTKDEFRSFSQFMKTKHNIDVDEDDIPVQDNQGGSYKRAMPVDDDADNTELSLKWLTSRAQRQMSDDIDDNPYSDLTPGDLSPSRLVNRKQAKQIPTKLLHHNNISLLRHFITQSGQIRHRIQTRLGARDQRRVSKLIKRGRAMGLIPYQSQFKYESRGWLHDDDIDEMRPWEKELVERGLVIEKSPPQKQQKK